MAAAGELMPFRSERRVIPVIDAGSHNLDSGNYQCQAEKMKQHCRIEQHYEPGEAHEN